MVHEQKEMTQKERTLQFSVLPMAILVLVLLLISLYTVFSLDKGIRESTIANMDSNVSARVILLRNYFSSAQREGFGLSQNPLAQRLLEYANTYPYTPVKTLLIRTAVKEDAMTLTSYLSGAIYYSGIYETIVFIDKNGRFVLDASDGLYETLPYDEMEFVKTAQRGGRSIGDFQLSPTSGLPILIAGNPVYNNENEIIGTAGTVFKFDVLSERVVRPGREDIFQYGILDEKGRVLAPADHNLPMEEGQAVIRADLREDIFSRRNGHVFYPSRDGRMLMVYTVLPEYNWVMYATVPTVTYIRKSEPIKKVVFLILLSVLLIAGTVAYRTAQLTVANRQYAETLQVLRETQEELVLSQKMASLGQLVTGMAHEINTPVGNCLVLSSYWQVQSQKIQNMLESGELKKGELKEYIAFNLESANRVESNMQHVASLVKSFKQIADIHEEEPLQEILVRNFIEEYLVELRSEMDMEMATIEVESSEQLSIQSPPGAIRQLLRQLISNSLIHGFEGRETGEIKIRVDRVEQTAIIEYQDNGIGLSDEVCSHIFDPFYTTKRSGTSSGLGMYVLYNTVTQLLGGTITCISEPDGGARFRILLPQDDNTRRPLSGAPVY